MPQRIWRCPCLIAGHGSRRSPIDTNDPPCQIPGPIVPRSRAHTATTTRLRITLPPRNRVRLPSLDLRTSAEQTNQDWHHEAASAHFQQRLKLARPGSPGRAIVGEPVRMRRAPSSAVGTGFQTDLAGNDLFLDNVDPKRRRLVTGRYELDFV